MVEDTGGRTGPSLRRRFILTSGALGVAGLAGCAGGGGEGSSGDGSEEAGAGLESSDGGGGSEEPSDPLLTDASEFDPAEPNWEENNYLLTAVAENDYFQGSKTDLENM